jgi:hypothetical protein
VGGGSPGLARAVYLPAGEVLLPAPLEGRLLVSMNVLWGRAYEPSHFFSTDIIFGFFGDCHNFVGDDVLAKHAQVGLRNQI